MSIGFYDNLTPELAKHRFSAMINDRVNGMSIAMISEKHRVSRSNVLKVLNIVDPGKKFSLPAGRTKENISVKKLVPIAIQMCVNGSQDGDKLDLTSFLKLNKLPEELYDSFIRKLKSETRKQLMLYE